MKNLQVPSKLDEDGVRHYLTYPIGQYDLTDNPPPFEASMRVDDTHRGRSSAQLVLKDQATGSTYPMFLRSIFEMLQTCDMKGGVISGWWHWVKRGSNYGIVYSAKGPECDGE